jgi:hypothetical protein
VGARTTRAKSRRAKRTVGRHSRFTMSNSAVFFVPAARLCVRVCLSSSHRLRHCFGGRARCNLGDISNSIAPEGWMERRQAHSLFLSRLRGATTASRCDRDPSRRSTVAIFGRGPTLLVSGSGPPVPQRLPAPRHQMPGGRGPDLPRCGFAPQSRDATPCSVSRIVSGRRPSMSEDVESSTIHSLSSQYRCRYVAKIIDMSG